MPLRGSLSPALPAYETSQKSGSASDSVSHEQGLRPPPGETPPPPTPPPYLKAFPSPPSVIWSSSVSASEGSVGQNLFSHAASSTGKSTGYSNATSTERYSWILLRPSLSHSKPASIAFTGDKLTYSSHPSMMPSASVSRFSGSVVVIAHASGVIDTKSPRSRKY